MRYKEAVAGVAWLSAAMGLAWASTAGAVNTDGYEIPYAGASFVYELPDSARDSDDGVGGQLHFGLPLGKYGYQNWALEATLHRLKRDRDIDGKSDYQTGLTFDWVYDFGEQSIGNFGGYRFKPFALAGVGVVQNDVRGSKHEHFAFDFGGGVLLPLGWKGLAARVEARALGQFDSKSTRDDILIDYRVTAGLQLPLFFLYPDHAPDTGKAAECELAVVDPLTGRGDCAVDSDRDGVPDDRDSCPGTATGVPVDAQGCPLVGSSGVSRPGDEDGDGVADANDRCPETRAGLAVDAHGCVVAQALPLSGVQFDNNTAILTDNARRQLDEVAATLQNQGNVHVQIIGHTDDVGSESYNLMLSQERAQSVRQYLIARGVESERLVASGRGSYQPIASNSTEAGRAQNRRVEFKLIIQ